MRNVPTRRLRGPMDHSVDNIGKDNGVVDAGNQMKANESRNHCSLDVGRFFLSKMTFLFMLLTSPHL